MHYDEQMTLI